MAGYIRSDLSCWLQHTCFLIPTIEISTWNKGYEIAFHFLWMEIDIILSYIKEEDYEP